MATNSATMELPIYPAGQEFLGPDLTDADIDQQIEEAGAKQRVSPLDPDFLVFALPTAVFFDLLSIVLTILAFFTLTISWWVWLIIDVIAMIPIGWWVYWRTGRIIKSKEQRKKEIQESLQKRAAALERQAASLEKIAAEEASQTARMAARSAAKTTTKTIARSTTKIFLRIGGRCLLKAIPLVGCFPFWSITVIETLKEK